MVAYSFQRRFVNAIRAGLGIDDLDGRWKRQTIRADRRRHARPGEDLQLYCGMRTKSCFLIGRARCIAIRPVTIFFARELDWTKKHHPWIKVGNEPRLGNEGRNAVDMFALNDGFSGWEEMDEFWRIEHPGLDCFHGVIIEWKPLT